jgi:hypothetical protein
VGEGFEVLETVTEGDWAGRFGFWVRSQGEVPKVDVDDEGLICDRRL